METSKEAIHLDLNTFVVLTLSLEFITIASVALDLPIIRQVAGFLFLSLVPGMTLMRTLNLQRQTIAEQVAFSIGLSVALLMFLGCLVNFIGPIIGFSHPLSLLPLLISTNTLVSTLCVYIYINEKGLIKDEHLIDEGKSHIVWPTTILLLALPALSILGSLVSRSTSNNAVYFLVILSISAFFFLTAASGKIVPERLLPLAIGTIAIALLLQTTTAFTYINGYDLHGEYYCFKLARDGFQWNPALEMSSLQLGSYNEMLSITVLPTFYSVVLNLSGELVFKIIYPILFSIVPILLFLLYRKFIEEKKAALSVFFFISFAVYFVTMTYLARQMIAELFFALLLLIYSQKSISRSEAFLLLVFSLALVVSHYATAYLCIFYVLIIVLLNLTKKGQSSICNLKYLLFLSMLTITWNIYVSTSASFEVLANSFGRIIVGLSDFFVGRDPNVLKGIGLTSYTSFWRSLGSWVFYATEILILLGVLKVFISRKKLRTNDFHFFGMMASMLLLFLSITLPFFSRGLNMTRLYQIALFFLAPAFVLGAEAVFNSVPIMLNRVRAVVFSSWNSRKCLLSISSVIIAYFLFQSGFVFALVGEIPTSPSLTTRRSEAVRNISLYDSFTFGEEVYGARWIAGNIYSEMPIYCDLISGRQVLRSYGLVSSDRVLLLSSNTRIAYGKAYIYLRHLNVVNRIIENETDLWILPRDSEVISKTNVIYANGGCEIFAGAKG